MKRHKSNHFKFVSLIYQRHIKGDRLLNIQKGLVLSYCRNMRVNIILNNMLHFYPWIVHILPFKHLTRSQSEYLTTDTNKWTHIRSGQEATEKKGKQLTAPLYPKLFATEDVMQQVLHVKRAQAHQTLRGLLSYKDVAWFFIFLLCRAASVYVHSCVYTAFLPEQCRLRASSVAITCMMSPILSRSMSPNTADWARMYMAR